MLNDQHMIEIAEAYTNKDDVSFMSGKLIYVIKYYIIVRFEFYFVHI